MRVSVFTSVALVDMAKPCDISRNGRSPGFGQESEVASVSGGCEVPHAASRKITADRRASVTGADTITDRSAARAAAARQVSSHSHVTYRNTARAAWGSHAP